jgi:hypothetical protein
MGEFKLGSERCGEKNGSEDRFGVCIGESGGFELDDPSLAWIAAGKR